LGFNNIRIAVKVLQGCIQGTVRQALAAVQEWQQQGCQQQKAMHPVLLLLLLLLLAILPPLLT
jgi:hypothetical protein